MKHSIVDILQEVLDSAGQNVDEKLYEPIPPGDFFLSEYHCGMPNSMIPKFWLDEAVDFIEGGYNELIITGSLGSFKTTWANLILLYKMYELFSHKSIHAYFDLPKIQDIYNIYFNVNMTQAQLTGFNQLKNMVDSSRWFSESFPRNKQLNSIISFPNNPNFRFLSGSGNQHAIGMTIWSFILDEGDFFKRNGTGYDESYSYVTNMYTELVDRRVSRFKRGEKDFSFSILISSASFQSSFVEKRISESLSETATTKVINAVTYKVTPERYSKEKFVVFKGNATCDPEIINCVADYNNIFSKIGLSTKVLGTTDILEAYERLSPELKSNFELPPVDLKLRFERNLGKSLQNFCGVHIAAEGKLFQSKGLLFSAYRPEILHPFSKQKIEVSNGDAVAIKDYFLPHYLNDLEKPHSMHLDGSVTGDSTGLSLVRFDGKVGNYRMYTQIFSLEIVPPPAPYRIKLSKVRDFIIYLAKEVGINIVLVTQDGYQSEDNLQLLADEGIQVARLSVDASDKPYLAWMSLLVDECVKMYKYQTLEDEAFAAIHNRRKGKVDHPKSEGSPNINVLQSFVGALWNLVRMDSDNIGTSDYNIVVPMQRERKELLVQTMVPKANYVPNIVSALMRQKKNRSIFDIIMEA